MKPINTQYQDIGDELKLGVLRGTQVIQTLWSGYGELVRLNFSNQHIIIKHVQLPRPSNHPRGWNTDRSHRRKLHSYQVEVNWYQNFSHIIDERCRTAKGLKCFLSENEWLIVMEDLATAGFEHSVTQPNRHHLKAVLIWLANFHARYLNTKSDLVWENGTYWHLETRPDELEALEDQELKIFAECIDNALRETTYSTIVHGDAKLANFCFNATGTLAAAVDFQYVGHGCGMKDVVYFMSSALEPEACEKMQIWVLDTYFSALQDALIHYQPQIQSSEVEREWRPLFEVAWADFQRFVKGWSPNHYKINPYTESLTVKALEYLRSR